MPYFLTMSCLEKPAASNRIEVEVVEHLEVARVIDDIGRVAIAPLDLHIPAVDEHPMILTRCHTQRGIETHHLAVQIGIVDHVQRQRGELVGMSEPARKRNRRG